MRHLLLLLFFIPVLVFSESLYSPTWGFGLDLPEGYDYVEGNAKDRFSFSGPGGVYFDLLVYNGTYAAMEDLVDDVNRRLGNQGVTDFFVYHNRRAAIVELTFADFTGWGLCVELGDSASAGTSVPMLLALSYSPAGNGADILHLSALDSIVPSVDEQYYPGPIMEYSYPRGEAKQAALASSGISAMIRENDAEAAQVFIEREFLILKQYLLSEYWRQAWIRYYRLVYRDSYDRISNAAYALVRNWGGNSRNAAGAEGQRELAQKALSWVQGFIYERHLDGSDFVNLVSAVTEGRGDCDSRAMLWAIILAHADIRAAIMVSREYSHAMGLADIDGIGARFEIDGTRWLVAETTDKIDIGLIDAGISNIENWLGILFD